MDDLRCGSDDGSSRAAGPKRFSYEEDVNEAPGMTAAEPVEVERDRPDSAEDHVSVEAFEGRETDEAPNFEQ
ncbi:hypothetical protein [Hansschlegelia sp.]|uniref:hypothetical protein n=1 Tax=Hansschlegelia sp. TaxID=2041892 RepID=UPI002C625E2E|nr:hypothetical protein [Hansschlegelia sp.]HVI27408.1 hypothetical protein [Hansschlegelia sp.]